MTDKSKSADPNDEESDGWRFYYEDILFIS